MSGIFLGHLLSRNDDVTAAGGASSPRAVPSDLPFPAPPAPAREAGPYFNASAWLRHAVLSPGPQGSHWSFDGAPAAPWPGSSRGRGWVEFSREELLSCAARAGGVAFVGDSVMRETVNALLRVVGGCCVDTTVTHAWQAHEVTLAAGGGATVRLAFRFARNAAPELGDHVARLLDSGVGAIVAGSGFWDLNPGRACFRAWKKKDMFARPKP